MIALQLKLHYGHLLRDCQAETVPENANVFSEALQCGLML